MPTRHRVLLLLLCALPALARALPQRVQVPPDSLPSANDITSPHSSTRNEDFLTGFFQSPAVLGITVALAVSLLIASLVTIVCLMRARRKAGVSGREGGERRGRGWGNGMGEGDGSLGRTVGGVGRDAEKAVGGGGWWRGRERTLVGRGGEGRGGGKREVGRRISSGEGK
ncbi:hypothetical protein MMC32_002428 [Xylographa parallela]|nr:hypothetical protein [Xylographa parallela]